MQCISINSYGERYTSPGWNYPNITRPFSIIYYALGGSAYYTIDGSEKPFEKNHLYIFPVNKVFSLRENPNDKFYSVYIHAFTSPEIDTLIDLDASKDDFIKQALELIRIYAKVKNEIYIRKLTDMLISYIFELIDESDHELPTEIKKYIDSNYTSVFSHNDISKHFNYSKSHMTKVFKEKYNLTPNQYARQLVLREIVQLLFKGISIAEIAEKLGFSSPENLSRFFKNCYGYSPSEYKKKFKDFQV